MQSLAKSTLFRRSREPPPEACKTAAVTPWPDAVQGSTPLSEDLGPISPELALVDHVLAERARALLPEPREQTRPAAIPVRAPSARLSTAAAALETDCGPRSARLRGGCRFRGPPRTKGRARIPSATRASGWCGAGRVYRWARASVASTVAAKRSSSGGGPEATRGRPQN